MVEEAMSGESGRESGKKSLRHAKIPCVACTQPLPVEMVPHPAGVRNVYHTVNADHIHLPGSSCLGGGTQQAHSFIYISFMMQDRVGPPAISFPRKAQS